MKEVGGIKVISYLSTDLANIALSHLAYDLEGAVISHSKRKKFASIQPAVHEVKCKRASLISTCVGLLDCCITM